METPVCCYSIGWKEFFQRKKNILFLVVSFFVALASLMVKKEFLKYNESRFGSMLHDQVLSQFNPHDISPFIFFFTYGAIIFGIAQCTLRPWRTIHLFMAISVLVVLRMITMYLIPLEPPSDIIPLEDPFLNSTFYGKAPYVKDLFFSGHTASVFMLFLLNRDQKITSKLLLMSSMILGCLLLVQHVHYTIDVVAAFPLTFLAYFGATKGMRFIQKNAMPEEMAALNTEFTYEK